MRWIIILGLLFVVGGFIFLFREALFWKTYETNWTYPGNHTGFKVSYPAVWEVKERKEYVGNIYPGWENQAIQYVADVCKDVGGCSVVDPTSPGSPVEVYVYYDPHDISVSVANIKTIYSKNKIMEEKSSSGEKNLEITQSNGKVKMKLIASDGGTYIAEGFYSQRFSIYPTYDLNLLNKLVKSFTLLKP